MNKNQGLPPNRTSRIRDWTQGSIVSNLLLLAWPVVVLSALWSVNLILEMIWVGRLGPSSIAGVGVAGFILLVVVSAKSTLSTGERAMVARYCGAGDFPSAERVAGQAFVISAVYGVVISVVGVFLVRPVFNLFGLEPEAVAEGVTYLRIVLAGWITEAFWISAFSVMQASGDTLTPMKVAIFIRCVNALICPFLVLGLWVFPRLGVAGAAVTYIVVTGLGMIITFWIFFSGRTRLRLRLSDFRPDAQIIWRILKIGIPASVAGLGKAFGDLILTRLVVPFGTLALAGNNLVSRIEGFINAPAAGLGTAGGVLIGQNLGARKPNQAARSGWLAVALVLIFMLVCAAALLIFAKQIIALFTVDPELIKLGSIFLRIAVGGYLGMSVVGVMQLNISGAGDTLPPMAISLAMTWLVQLPLAFLLSRYTALEVYGVRWAILISFLLGAGAYLAYFRLGRWKRKKI